jgi:hypothetical protein
MSVNVKLLKFETLPSIPTHIKLAAKLVNKRISDLAKIKGSWLDVYIPLGIK